MAQHFIAPTLHIDSFDNTFSILEMDPLESFTLHFFLWKEYCFFFTLTTPTSSTSDMWVSLYEIRCSMRGYPSRIIWTSNHFQMVIIVDIVVGQYKMQNPTWSSPSQSSRIASYGSHTTTLPFVRKTSSSSTRSHSAPCHLDRVYLNFSLSHHGHALCHNSQVHSPS